MTMVITACMLGLGGGPLSAAPSNQIGMNVHHPKPDVLDAAVDLGVDWIRIDFTWGDIQKASTQPPDFAFFDTIVDGALQRGLKVFATVGYVPAWASEADNDGNIYNNAPKQGLYGAFCKAAAQHFLGRIEHWGLWNEPNLSQFYEGSRQLWLARIVVEGLKGIRAGCASCKVMGPELASAKGDYHEWLDDALARLKAEGDMYDVVTHHTYHSFADLEKPWFCWDGALFVHDIDQQRKCFGVSVGNTPIRDVLLKHGLGTVEVWITETGYKAEASHGSDLQKQRTYYRHVLEEQLKRDWWTTTIFYELSDSPQWPDKWGVSARNGNMYPQDWQLKPVWELLTQVFDHAASFGGSGKECADGLDNDGDGAVDYPADGDCSSSGSMSESVMAAPDAGVADLLPIDMLPADLPPADLPPADLPPADLTPVDSRPADIALVDASVAHDSLILDHSAPWDAVSDSDLVGPAVEQGTGCTIALEDNLPTIPLVVMGLFLLVCLPMFRRQTD